MTSDPAAYFDQAVETAPRERLRDIQSAKLGELLRTIWGRNRFYTDKLSEAGIDPREHRRIDELCHFPLTTKAELISAQADGGTLSTNCTFPERAYQRVHQTSGTTGEPLTVYDTADSWDWWGRCWGFVLAGAGLTARDRVFMPFSFGPFIGFWAAVGGAGHIGAMMIPGGGQTSRQRR